MAANKALFPWNMSIMSTKRLAGHCAFTVVFDTSTVRPGHVLHPWFCHMKDVWCLNNAALMACI